MARGSKPGERRGGRQKGTPNKRSVALEEKVREAAEIIESTLPEAFKGDAHALLMTVYKDPLHPMPLRIDAAKAAIGFEKPKLAALQHTGDKENPVAFTVATGVPRRTTAERHDDERPANRFDA